MEILRCKDVSGYVRLGKYNYLRTIYKRQCEILKDMYKKKQISLTELLDLLAIRSMECNKEDGKCWNGYDIGPFQINKIHKEVVKLSRKLWNKKEELFKLQANYALGLVRYRQNKYCRRERTKINKNRFICVYRTYNGSTGITGWYRGYLAWLKREKIKNILILN